MSEQKGRKDLLGQVLKGAAEITYWLGGLLLFLTMFFSTAEVIARYILRRPIGWTFEVVEYILVAATFLTCARIQAHDSHLKVDILVNRLSGKGRIGLNAVAEILTSAFCVLIVWATWRVAWRSVWFGLRSESAYQLPLAPYQFLVVLGGVLLVFVCLVRTGQFVRKYLHRA